MDKSAMIQNLLQAHDALSHVFVMSEDPNLLNMMAAKNTILAVVNALNQPEEQPQQLEQLEKTDQDEQEPKKTESPEQTCKAIPC